MNNFSDYIVSGIRYLFDGMMMMSVLYQASMLSWNFIELAHRNNSPQSDMLLHSDTLSRLRRPALFGFINTTYCISYESFHVDWQNLRCLLTFSFVVLILANDFSCYLCFSFCIQFCGLIEPPKTTKISIRWINMKSQYQVVHTFAWNSFWRITVLWWINFWTWTFTFFPYDI